MYAYRHISKETVEKTPRLYIQVDVIKKKHHLQFGPRTSIGTDIRNIRHRYQHFLSVLDTEPVQRMDPPLP